MRTSLMLVPSLQPTICTTYNSSATSSCVHTWWISNVIVQSPASIHSVRWNEWSQQLAILSWIYWILLCFFSPHELSFWGVTKQSLYIKQWISHQSSHIFILAPFHLYYYTIWWMSENSSSAQGYLQAWAGKMSSDKVWYFFFVCEQSLSRVTIFNF